MKIVQPSAKIEGIIDGQVILEHIERCGRTAYKSSKLYGVLDPDDGYVIEIPNGFDTVAVACYPFATHTEAMAVAQKYQVDVDHHVITEIVSVPAQVFVAMIIKRGHESVLEHASVSVRVICDRGISHELVRHRLCTFTQESTRYCDYRDSEIEFVLPTDITGGDRIGWIANMRSIEAHYMTLRNGGTPPQIARSVLPNALKTELVMTANLREWRHIFKLRCASAAHPQMREIMIPLLKQFHNQIPVVFDDLFNQFLDEGDE